jgi:hypothetical protein
MPLWFRTDRRWRLLPGRLKFFSQNRISRPAAGRRKRFRDPLCRKFAAEVAKRSGGEIAAEVYPNSALVKTTAQFQAMRKGALDISLYPFPMPAANCRKPISA